MGQVDEEMFDIKVRLDRDGREVSFVCPTDSTVGAVIERANALLGVSTRELCTSSGGGDCVLPAGDLLADYYEPDVVYQVRTRPSFAAVLLFSVDADVLESFGLDLMNAKLLMQAEGGFVVSDFWKITTGIRPTLLVVQVRDGLKSGGFSAVPWPRESEWVADPSHPSFIFQLGKGPKVFHLVRAQQASRPRTRHSTSAARTLSVCCARVAHGRTAWAATKAPTWHRLGRFEAPGGSGNSGNMRLVSGNVRRPSSPLKAPFTTPQPLERSLAEMAIGDELVRLPASGQDGQDSGHTGETRATGVLLVAACNTRAKLLSALR
jgi:hypothetical protein